MALTFLLKGVNVLVTSIGKVTNASEEDIVFINVQDEANDRHIRSGGSVDAGNCWIPWCRPDEDFRAHHIKLRTESYNPAIPAFAYLWQQDSYVDPNNGYHFPPAIVFSTDGYHPPGIAEWCLTNDGNDQPIDGRQYELFVPSLLGVTLLLYTM